MAKRSDFAQKLLDDLRLRKERMASSQSQRSTQSNQLPIDAYAYSKQTYRGSRNVKASEAGLQVTSRTGDSLSRPSSRSHRTAITGEASDQIVVYGRGQNSVQLSDISLALAYAFDNNGGKLRRADSSLTSSMMGFLHQIKRGTMEYGKMGRGSNLDMQLTTANQFPTFSPAQINEISKGVQKLNQILRACSNGGGLNMDRYSIEFAKELLQGAMDLEESLRMLVDLQKSSDSMKDSQKKNRITLIEGHNDDDDDDDRSTMTSDQRQLAPPRFSFIKSSRNSHKLQDVGNGSLVQKPLALTYCKERRNLSNEKQDVNILKLLPHRHSSSSISDDKNLNYSLSEQKNQSASMKSNTEKPRIPNVIAKLMGLDNIPEKVKSGNPSQKDSGSTPKMEGTAKKSELKRQKAENLTPPKQQKVIEPVIVSKTQQKEQMHVADENLIIQKASSEVAVKNGTTLWRELNEIKASKGLEKGTIKVEKQPNNSDKMNLNSESGKDFQANGRKPVQATNREQKVAVKGRTNDFLLNNMLAQLEQGHERSKVDSSLLEEKEGIGSVPQPVKKNKNKEETNQKKSQNHLGIQNPFALLKYGPQEEWRHREKQLQHREKHMLETRLKKGRETSLKNSSKPSHDVTNSQKKQTLGSQSTTFKHNSAENVDVMKSEGFLVRDYNDLYQDEASNEFNVKVKQVNNRKPGQITFPRNQHSEPITGKNGLTTMMDKKSFHKQATEKVKNTRKKKSDSSGKIEEVLTRRNGPMVHSTVQVKQRSPILKEVRRTASESGKFDLSKEAKQERVSMSKEADARIISSNDSVSTIEPLDVRQQPHPEAELAPTLYNSDGGKVQGLQESVDLVPNNLNHDVKSVATNDKQHATPLSADGKIESCEIEPTTINGVHEGSIDINYHSQRQDQRIPEKRMREPLTESENGLKWILVTSQPFLNTAEALFKLNIPFGILQGCGGVENQDEEASKLILDCSYEVMKSKGIRQELKVHPYSKSSISPFKIRSLDDLVRQLNEDMEKLKFYGRNRTSPVQVEDYLPKMLENDVYNKHPDIDSMWDLGWNQETFAFLEQYDVTRDMEKHILNGLLDEITWEIANVQGGLD